MLITTISINYHGSYFLAECQRMGTTKLRLRNHAADKKGFIILKKAIAAFNRQDAYFHYRNENFNYLITNGASGLFGLPF